MLRSMYSGISGMKNFQTKLDVIGNNIANVNTYGFKKGRATFKDLVSQQVAGASNGTNPKQVGLGSQLATIDTIDTQGSTQTTGRALDLAISGDGYFKVRTSNGDLLTRAGNFYLNNNGTIVNGDGYELLDTGNNPITIPQNASSFSIGPDGKITVVGAASPGASIGITKVTNPGGLEKAGSNLYRPTANSQIVSNTSPGTGGAGDLVSGALEMSNVDLSEEFTDMIVAQRGFQANTKIITTSDEILQELVNLKR
ncbi:flagellar hook protein FlgE [Fictibacillus solisalsi]|uniref:Flagellar hook protein FlgE n=1 Tax=Fictibacillus solisalsi TaxID=459525 RepID=A0A1G9UYE1_9BACL|nr:flagellar basal body rod protein FlgG [Fictibacillus solisalsi]SDM64685.1 flagellar hook protein FlgE [Fictibacillus solisalsi]